MDLKKDLENQLVQAIEAGNKELAAELEAKLEALVVSDDEPEIDVSAQDLDWKAAAKKLKDCVTNIHSIDWYLKKDAITDLRERYNGKERTAELHEAIMAL